MEKDKNDLEHLMNFIIGDILKLKSICNFDEICTLFTITKDVYESIESDIKQSIKNLKYEAKRKIFTQELVCIENKEIDYYEKMIDKDFYNLIFSNYVSVLETNIKTKKLLLLSEKSLKNLYAYHKILKGSPLKEPPLKEPPLKEPPLKEPPLKEQHLSGGAIYPINWEDQIEPKNLKKLNILIDDILKLNENDLFDMFKTTKDKIIALEYIGISVNDKINILLKLFKWSLDELNNPANNINKIIDECIIDYIGLLGNDRLKLNDRVKKFTNINVSQQGGFNKTNSKRANSKKTNSKRANSKRANSKKTNSKRANSKKTNSKKTNSKKISKRKGSEI